MVRWQVIALSLGLLALHTVWGNDDESHDKPLVVTSLLEAGKFKEAQEEALVTPDIGGVKSYAGFFNVDKKCGNNLFFWFFSAAKDWKTAPVLLWLNSYSRRSVLIQVFLDAGPFSYNRVEGFRKRENALTNDNNVLFIDHPVDSGFSFSEKECYPDNLNKIYQDVNAAVVQFFMLFPNLNKNKFFIVGQNFAGKYAPGIAMEIDRSNKHATQKINLVGIVIGDPYLDLRCHSTSEYEYQLGIIDKKTKMIDFNNDKTINDAIDAKDYSGASDLAEKFRRWPFLGKPEVRNGIPSIHNVLYDNDAPEEDFETFIRSYQTRSQLNVGNTAFHPFSDKLRKSLRPTIYEPVNSKVEELLNTGKYIVGFYGGQLDAHSPYTAIPCVLEGLKWTGLDDYLAAKRSSWYVDDRLAGWVKVSGNVWEVAMRDSGLYTTRDQPWATYILLQAALADTPGEKLLSGLTYVAKPSAN